MAVLLTAQGKYVKAAASYHRALAIYEHTLDPAHPKRGTAQENYAALLAKRGGDHPNSKITT